MVAWDSVTGHHLGLRHAHQSFIKGFYKTDTTKVTDLFRNGIMHGSLVDFDNERVAAKAWNRLFAVSDWAEAQKRRENTTEAPASREAGTVRARAQFAFVLLLSVAVAVGIVLS